MPRGKYKRQPKLCKVCGTTDEAEFYLHRRNECKTCLCARTSARQRGDSELHRRRHLKRAYGWTPEKYDSELVKQHGLCALCGKPPDETDLQKSLMVDHDHETGKPRGLIHGRCNAVLGYAKDDTAIFMAAIHYINRYKKL